MLRFPAVLWLDLTVKAALLALLILAVVSDAQQFQGKAMEGRALTYPLAAIVVPIGWWAWGRHKTRHYPFGLDIFLVLPFLIDTAGNALDLYDTIEWWDDFNHFLNWGILTAAFGQLVIRYPLARLNTASLAVGFGAATAVLWEIAEYYTFIRGGAEERTAYTDTLADLALGITGSTIAALLTVTAAWRLQKEPGTRRFRSD